LLLRKGHGCAFYLGDILLRDLRRTTLLGEYYSASWWMTAIEGKRAPVLSVRLGLVTSTSRSRMAGVVDHRMVGCLTFPTKIYNQGTTPTKQSIWSVRQSNELVIRMTCTKDPEQSIHNAKGNTSRCGVDRCTSHGLPEMSCALLLQWTRRMQAGVIV
jgi:hypothetical protein